MSNMTGKKLPHGLWIPTLWLDFSGRFRFLRLKPERFLCDDGCNYDLLFQVKSDNV